VEERHIGYSPQSSAGAVVGAVGPAGWRMLSNSTSADFQARQAVSPDLEGQTVAT